MQRSVFLSRSVVAGLAFAGVVAASGCGWLHKPNELYAPAPENRPLEVPPDLDLPDTQGAMGGATGPVTASGVEAAGGTSQAAAPGAPAPAAGGEGFTVSGSRDEIFEQVGEALAATEGVEIASRAQLLGAFDVNYQGSNFLVRVSEVDAGAYVSAVDPRGVPATGPAPTQLIAALKVALGAQ